MASRVSRLERITNLLLALLDTSRPLSLREIGSQVAGYPSEPGALRQAFERDKRTLRDGGIPIAVERIDADEQVGYRILPEQYYLPELGLEPDEQAALAVALAAVRLDGGAGRGVAAKLGAPVTPELPPIALLPSLPALGSLQDAIRRRARVAFSYHGRPRSVEGYGLVFTAGSWYFIGHDERAKPEGALRTFRVDRLEDEPVVGPPGAFEVPEGFDARRELDLAPFGAATAREATEVILDVDVRDASGVLALVGTDALVARREDGSVRLCFRIGDEEAFIAWVLGLADAAELVAPAELRRRVVERLSSLAASAPGSTGVDW